MGATFREETRLRWKRDPLRDGYLLAGVVFVAIVGLGLAPWLGVDAHAYWLARMPDPYVASVYGARGAFYYSPVIAQLLAPLTLLPWSLFHALLTAVNLALLWWLVGRWAILAIFIPNVAMEFYSGNIHLWLAAAMVVALDRPAFWSFPLLTKVTLGVGVLWHLFRGEWRRLAIAFLATLLVIAVSFVLAPNAWTAWLTILSSNTGMMPPANAVPVPLLYRLPIAVLLVAVGARTGRAWLVPVAATLAIPVLWLPGAPLFLAIPRLLRTPRPALAPLVGPGGRTKAATA